VDGQRRDQDGLALLTANAAIAGGTFPYRLVSRDAENVCALTDGLTCRRIATTVAAIGTCGAAKGLKGASRAPNKYNWSIPSAKG
jgi:hypothetical protein